MSAFSSTPIVIDAKDHLLGRLASTVAKQILSGQPVVVVRTELLNISGGFFRAKLKYSDFLRKRHLVKPSKQGPFHVRSPAGIFSRVVRGMTPHKTARGKEALARFKAFEGIPPPFDKKKRVVVPHALRVLRLKPGRKYAVLQRLSHEFGWSHKDVVNKLEEKRKVKAVAFYERKKALQKAANAASKDASIQPVAQKLAVYGY